MICVPHANLPVGVGDGDAASGVEAAHVARGDVGAGLLDGLSDAVDKALLVQEVLVARGGAVNPAGGRDFANEHSSSVRVSARGEGWGQTGEPRPLRQQCVKGRAWCWAWSGRASWHARLLARAGVGAAGDEHRRGLGGGARLLAGGAALAEVDRARPLVAPARAVVARGEVGAGAAAGARRHAARPGVAPAHAAAGDERGFENVG